MHLQIHSGGLIGTLPTEQHGVSGQFYVVDSKTLIIDNFNYDGLGPGESNVMPRLCRGGGAKRKGKGEGERERERERERYIHAELCTF